MESLGVHVEYQDGGSDFKIHLIRYIQFIDYTDQ